MKNAKLVAQAVVGIGLGLGLYSKLCDLAEEIDTLYHDKYGYDDEDWTDYCKAIAWIVSLSVGCGYFGQVISKKIFDSFE